ncbi:DUF742 domain-containing protein [Streptomyces hebeiensis]
MATPPGGHPYDGGLRSPGEQARNRFNFPSTPSRQSGQGGTDGGAGQDGTGGMPRRHPVYQQPPERQPYEQPPQGPPVSPHLGQPYEEPAPRQSYGDHGQQEYSGHEPYEQPAPQGQSYEQSASQPYESQPYERQAPQPARQQQPQSEERPAGQRPFEQNRSRPAEEPRRSPEPSMGTHNPLVRPYAMTGGRTRPRYQLAIEALVSTTADPSQLHGQLPEHQRICRLCIEIKSVAEISALLSIPLGVARILVADLAEAGLVAIHQPGGDESVGGQPDVTLLERVLSGLRKL